MSRKTFYNRIMQVKRLNVSAQDAVGGVSPVTIEVNRARCRIRQLTSAEILPETKNGVVSTHRVYSNETNIKNKDEIIIDKTIYDVNSVNPGSAMKGSYEIEVTLRV